MYFAMVRESDGYGGHTDVRLGLPTREMGKSISKVVKKRKDGFVMDEHNVVRAAITNGIVKTFAHYGRER